jgi:hypothetical protein
MERDSTAGLHPRACTRGLHRGPASRSASRACPGEADRAMAFLRRERGGADSVGTLRVVCASADFVFRHVASSAGGSA